MISSFACTRIVTAIVLLGLATSLSHAQPIGEHGLLLPLEKDKITGKVVGIAVLTQVTQTPEEELRKLASYPELTSLTFGAWPDVPFDKQDRTTELSVVVKHLALLKKLKRLSFAARDQEKEKDKSVWLCDKDLVELAQLKDLESLDLGGQPITSSGIEHLEGMSNLRELTLIETDVDDKAVPSLIKLPKLRYLAVANTRVTIEGIDQLISKGKLSELDGFYRWVENTPKGPKLPTFKDMTRFGGTDKPTFGRELEGQVEAEQPSQYSLYHARNVSVWLRFLLAKTTLETLDLGSSDVTDKDLEQLAGNQTLTELSLESTAITDAGLKSLRTIPHLRSVSLHESRVTSEGLRHLAELPELEHLHISPTHFGPGFNLICEANRLKELEVSWTAVGKSSLTHMDSLRSCSKLERLKINRLYPYRGDDRFSFFDGLDNLKHLHLDAAGHIKGDCLAKLPHPEKLETLHVDQALLQVDRMDALQKMSQLRSLNISSSYLDGSLVRQLGSMEKLEFLKVTRTGTMQGNSKGATASRAEMESLSNLKELNELRLSGIQLSSDGMEHLASLPKLERIHFYRVDVDDRAIPHLIKMPAIKWLTIYGHQFSPEGRQQLVKALPVTKGSRQGPATGFYD